MKKVFEKIRIYFKYLNKNNRMKEFGFESFDRFEKEIMTSREFRKFLYDFLGKSI